MIFKDTNRYWATKYVKNVGSISFCVAVMLGSLNAAVIWADYLSSEAAQQQLWLLRDFQGVSYNTRTIKP